MYKEVAYDKVILHHLTRRLEGNWDTNILNLRELLTTNNAMSTFLNEYGFAFEINTEGLLIATYLGEDIFLGKDSHEYYSYARVKGRLNRNLYTGQCDSCINTFLFGDESFILNDMNSYYRSLFFAPEIITDLDCLCPSSKIQSAYMKKSTRYLLSFEVDINQCIYDNGDCPPLLNVLHTLCQEFLKGGIWPDDNPIIRLPDSMNLSRSNIVRVLEIKDHNNIVKVKL